MFNSFKRPTIKSSEVNEVASLKGKINLIDIREPNEYKSGHLPKTKNISMDELISNADKYLDKSKEYYIICRTGSRSSRTCRILTKRGFNVINVSRGTVGYKGKLQ